MTHTTRKSSDRAPQRPAGSLLHTGMVRVSAYSAAGVLAVLMMTSALPPLLADQSDRAVVNAPVTLLTAPISGEVTGLSTRVGQRVAAGAPIASIKNTRVDRSTLITLQGKVAELQQSEMAASQKKDANLQYVVSMDVEIRRQTDQAISRVQAEIAELRALVAASESSGQEKKAIVDRQTHMLSRDEISREMVKPASQQYAAALHQRDAETAKLDQKVSELGALRQGIYVGDNLAELSAMAQKRRDIGLDAKRLAIEESQLAANIRDQQVLLDAERKRLDSLAEATLSAPYRGEILNVGVATGRHVSAGDSLASLVNCERDFVVAIFSYRQAQDFAVGTRVRISGGSSPDTRYGVVSEILPKASDKTDEQFAVPFPQTERREMYVLVTPESPPSEASRNVAAPEPNRTSCSVGEWVTVTRDGGWIPSTSVVWRSVRNRLTGVAASMFPSQSAQAADRALRQARLAQ